MNEHFVGEKHLHFIRDHSTGMVLPGCRALGVVTSDSAYPMDTRSRNGKETSRSAAAAKRPARQRR